MGGVKMSNIASNIRMYIKSSFSKSDKRQSKNRVSNANAKFRDHG